MENTIGKIDFKEGSIIHVNRFVTGDDVNTKFLGRIGKIVFINKDSQLTTYKVDFGDLGLCDKLFVGELVSLFINVPLLNLLGFNHVTGATKIKEGKPLYYKHGYPYQVFVEKIDKFYTYWFGIIGVSDGKNNQIQYLDELIAKLKNSDIEKDISLILGKKAENGYLLV